jgi:ribosomal protein S8
MPEKRKTSERRKKERRRLLTEKEFRKLIEEGKVSKADRREWEKRRKIKRRKKQMGV